MMFSFLRNQASAQAALAASDLTDSLIALGATISSTPFFSVATDFSGTTSTGSVTLRHIMGAFSHFFYSCALVIRTCFLTIPL
jgi:hypothetical protein